MVKICIGCRKEFTPKWSKARYCSISCSKIGNRNPKWRGGVKEQKCLYCGILFTPNDSHIERDVKYCSIRCSKLGENNPNWNGKVAAKGESHPFWKGDSVGVDALHTYIRRLLPKPELCQCCQNEPPYDLANISQEYKRDVSDWEWLCRRCHMQKDGRLGNLKQYNNKV
jgi:hypothetical protein